MSAQINPMTLLFETDDKILNCNIQKAQTHVNIYKLSKYEPDDVNREFMCINPIRGQRNLKTEVASFRNFLFESDKLPIDARFALLPALIELDIFRTITYSGGKSLHCIVSVADYLDLGTPGSEEAETRYKQIWNGLREHIEAAGLTGVDPTNANPTTLTRFPNAIRTETNKIQNLLHVGSLLPSEVVRGYCKNGASTSKAIIVPQTFSGTFEQFESFLWRPENQNFFRYFLCPNWVSSSNNYPMIRRLAWWSVDAFNCSEELFLQLVQKYLEPEFSALGYFRNHSQVIKQLFKWKRLKARFENK